jgi:hypothetical protein
MEWKFADYTDTLDNVGFKDNDIEKFGQDPAKSIVREAIQNSCDALDIGSNKTMVKVIIKTGSVNKNTLPNFSKIEDHIKNCIHKENDHSENLEIKRHVNAFEKDKHQYQYLEISDYNTTGMDLKSFENLTQGIFKSNKSNAGSQGSKGVGKAAYYAGSYLRTMLIVSKNSEGLRYRGAAKIATHTNPNNNSEKLNYKGLYGTTSLVGNHEIPDLFRRDENGTSIFIMGLWDFTNLDQNIIQEVLRNYWFAIQSKQLTVIVNEKEINSDNIKQYIDEFFKDFKDYKTGDRQNPRPYFETVTKGKEYKKNIDNIGECSLWLHENSQFPLGAVARFRKTKMLIYKEQDLDFGFSGVFLCDNEEGNIFLKEIENDAHDTWNANINKDYKEKATITLKQIKEFIRESYKQFAGSSERPTFNLDIIDNLFNFFDSREVKKAQNKLPQAKKEVTEIVRDRIVTSAQFKSFLKDGEIHYKLELNSLIDKKLQEFKISIGTDSSKDDINILDASSGTFNSNTLTLDVKKGLNIVDRIKLDVPFLVAPSLTSINE